MAQKMDPRGGLLALALLALGPLVLVGVRWLPSRACVELVDISWPSSSVVCWECCCPQLALMYVSGMSTPKACRAWAYPPAKRALPLLPCLFSPNNNACSLEPADMQAWQATLLARPECGQCPSSAAATAAPPPQAEASSGSDETHKKLANLMVSLLAAIPSRQARGSFTTLPLPLPGRSGACAGCPGVRGCARLRRGAALPTLAAEQPCAAWQPSCSQGSPSALWPSAGA